MIFPLPNGPFDGLQRGAPAGQPAVRRAVVVPHPHREQLLELLEGDDQAQIAAHVAELAQDVGAVRTRGSGQAMRESLRDGAEEALNEGPVIRIVGRTHIGRAAQEFTRHIEAVGGEVRPCVVEADRAPTRVGGFRERGRGETAAREGFQVPDGNRR
jgi:hypothetical protein